MHEVPSEAIRAWSKGNRGNQEILWPSSAFVRCPKCRERQVFAIKTDVNNVVGRRATQAQCASAGCGQNVVFYITDIGGKRSPMQGRLWIHPSVDERAPLPIEAHLSNELAAEYRDALDMLASGLARPAAQHARLVLEAIVRRLTDAAPRSQLAPLLATLKDRVDLAKPLIDATDVLREGGGNLAAHFEEGRPVSPEAAARMIELLEAFIEYVYILPERVAELRADLARTTEPDA